MEGWVTLREVYENLVLQECIKTAKKILEMKIEQNEETFKQLVKILFELALAVREIPK